MEGGLLAEARPGGNHPTEARAPRNVPVRSVLQQGGAGVTPQFINHLIDGLGWGRARAPRAAPHRASPAACVDLRPALAVATTPLGWLWWATSATSSTNFLHAAGAAGGGFAREGSGAPPRGCPHLLS